MSVLISSMRQSVFLAEICKKNDKSRRRQSIPKLCDSAQKGLPPPNRMTDRYFIEIFCIDYCTVLRACAPYNFYKLCVNGMCCARAPRLGEVATMAENSVHFAILMSFLGGG